MKRYLIIAITYLRNQLGIEVLIFSQEKNRCCCSVSSVDGDISQLLDPPLSYLLAIRQVGQHFASSGTLKRRLKNTEMTKL
jgi:hypothetical protein